ncbi:MAG: hypothetical protein Q4A71_05545 [Actinomycetaceae bacterium]|nr:hypothetical protein [Actinomycetaceae bacterium]
MIRGTIPSYKVSCSVIARLETRDRPEREGIITKAITALQDLIKRGYRFNEPQIVVEARNTYHAQNNTIVAFNTECLSFEQTDVQALDR